MTSLDVQEPQGQEQEPQKKPEPKPQQQQRPDSDFTSPEQAERFRASEQMSADARASIARGEPPPDFEGRVARLIKAKADGFMQSLVDDRGRVLREAMEPDAAMRRALELFQKHMQREGGADEIRNYLDGGADLPNGWVPAVGTIKSAETRELEWRAKLGRENANPSYLAAKDWVLDPAGNILPAVVQVGADLIVGGLKHVGAVDPNAHIDVKERFYKDIPEALGLHGTTRDEMDAIANAAGGASKVLRGSGELVGTAYGFTAGVPGKVLGVFGNVAGAAGKALFRGSQVAEKVAHGAGVFGAFEGITAEPGHVAEGVAKGAAAGAAMGFAQGVTSAALRAMFRTPVKALGPDEKSAMDALKKWAGENKVFAERGESPAAFDKRIVDTWINAGLPGAPAMPARKLMGYAMRGGADAAGFSLLDQQFREDLIDAAWHGDRSKWESVITKFSGNFLGAAALHMPLSSIVPWQRRQSVGKARNASEPVETEAREIPAEQVEPAPKRESQDADFSVQPKEPLQLPAPKETRAEKLTKEANDAMAREYASRWETLLGTAQEQSHWEQAIGSSLDNVIALGWKPSEKSVRERAEGEPGPAKVKIELSQSGHSFTIDGENGKPSPALREALNLPATMPARELVDAVEKASLQSALHTKAMLPGQEIAVGVKGTSGKGDEPAKMRRVVMGEIQESPLSPEPKWEKVDEAPARGKDALDQAQAQAVEELRRVAETSDTLDPADRSLLNAAIDVLDTVAARNDQSVAETMDAMPKLMEGLEQPGGVKALAEALTTKVPEKAIGDMDIFERAQRASEERKALAAELGAKGEPVQMKHADGRTALVGPDVKKPGAFRVTRFDADGPIGHTEHPSLAAAVEHAIRDGFKPETKKSVPLVKNEKGYEFPTYNGERLSWDPGLYTTAKEQQAGYPRAKAVLEAMAEHRPEQLNKYRRDLLRSVGDRAFGHNAERALNLVEEVLGKDRSGERGSADLGAISDTANAAFDFAKDIGGTALDVAKKPIEFFQRSQIQAVEDAGMRDIAENVGRAGTTAAKRFQTRMDSAGLMDLRRTPRAELDSLGELKADGLGGYADEFSRAMDAGTARAFGEASLTDAQREIVDKARAVTHEAGVIAEEIGVETTDSKGKNARPFKADAERRIMVREYTPEAQEARRQQSGPLYEAMLGWLERKYGWTPEEARKQFSGDAQALTALDATEIRRSIDAMPTHLDVDGRSEPVRILESRPLEYAERLAHRSSNILGARSVMPRFAEPKDGAKSLPTPPDLEPLPPTAQQLVDSVLNDGKPKAQERAELVARMVRAMHGLPMKAGARIFRPGEKGYDVARVFSALVGLPKAAALSMSFAANVAEPISNAAHFGTQAITKGYGEVLRAVVTGRFAELHREAVESGFLADTKLNNPWKGETRAEDWINLMRKAGDLLTAPLRITQDFNELVNYAAARDRLAAMKAGEGSKADANALSLLGFKGPEIDAMLRGEGTQEQYERYQRNIIGNLAGGKSMRGAEASDAAHSRGFNSLVWFTNFFQARSRAVASLARDVVRAPTPEARTDAMAALLKFGAATAASGAVGALFKQYLLGGSEGMADYIREQTSQGAGDTAANILGLIASGIVGGAGQPLVDAAKSLGEPGDPRDELYARAGRLLGPVDAGLKFVNLLRALGGADVPGYENTDKLGKAGKYLRDVMPAARAVHEGLFGVSALAISEKSIDLDNAQDSYYRWLRENRPQDLKSRGRPEEQREFRDSMRAVMDRVAAGKRWSDDDLVAAVIDAESARLQSGKAKLAAAKEQGARDRTLPSELYREARAAVAASLRNRKMLPEPGQFTTAQRESLERHLGSKHLQTLRDHDAVIDLLAKRVQGANLRRQAEAAR